MAVVGAEINGCGVLASGTIAVRGRDEVYLMPLGDAADYKIKLSIEFSDSYSHKPSITGAPGIEHFDVMIRRGWYEGKNGAFFNLLIGESDTAKLYMNLFFAIAGTIEEYVVNYSYTIFVKTNDKSL